MKKILFSLAFIGAMFSFCGFVYAQSKTEVDLSAFKQYREVPTISAKIPTVINIPFTEQFTSSIIAVYDNVAKTFVPSSLKGGYSEKGSAFVVSDVSGKLYDMNDNNFDTFNEFDLSLAEEKGSVTLQLKSDELITSSSFTAMFDKNVALPNTIAINAVVGGQEKVILAQTVMNSQTVNFPKTTSKEWIITMIYSQPLRIVEISLNQQNSQLVQTNNLRFLAQPGHDYKIYFNADRPVGTYFGETGDLMSDEGVLTISNSKVFTNGLYKQSDSDKDGIPDLLDNCVSVANPDQKDIDGNKRGDTCDDFDKDGVINSVDNCPNTANYNQRDSDGDKIGDVCDTEESRLTEKYKFLPWFGIGFAALVIIGMLIVMIKGMIKPVGR
jgi:hypothetical protein